MILATLEAAAAVAVTVLIQKEGPMVEAGAEVQVIAEAGAEGWTLLWDDSCFYVFINIWFWHHYHCH